MKKGVHELSTAAFNARMVVAWLQAAKVQAPDLSDELQAIAIDAGIVACSIAKIFERLAGEENQK